MATSTALRPSVRAAFEALIDYAGLFPPARLPMNAAQREYETARAGPFAWMLGRFIIPAGMLESCSALKAPFSTILDGGSAQLSGVARLRGENVAIAALEIPLRQTLSPDETPHAIRELRERIDDAGLGDLAAFVEVPRSERWPDLLPAAMSALSQARLGAKLRCGGVSVEAFPSVEEVADFIMAANRSGVPFKATAGLHHPVRHRDPASGFMMHGFLNLLAAAALAPAIGQETLRDVIAEEEPRAFAFDDSSFAWRAERIGIPRLEATRRSAFVAYGSCSFCEPIEDLSGLGILSAQ
jgi:hypothetical protein